MELIRGSFIPGAPRNSRFCSSLGLLFWDHFLSEWQRQPFQLCGCHPSGVPIVLAVQAVARRLNIKVGAFLARREPKFGAETWFDGVPSNVPVLMVDDVAASAPFMLQAAARVQSKLRLELHRNCFAIVNKVGRGFDKASQHTENYLDNELVALFTMNNFCRDAQTYREKYGAVPKWSGFVG